MGLNKTKKMKIAKKIFGHTQQQVDKDYKKLRSITCKNIKQYSPIAEV